MRRELGQLLQAKQELTARIRVEHVFREQNIMAAYEIIELFCELLVVRLPIIETQRQCPIDLQEAIASLIFSAPRCADLPELQDLSSLFALKYGKDFVAAAAELRPDCGVNRLVIEKLSVRASSDAVRLKLMKEIAEEQGVDWDTKEAEAELCKASQDLLGNKEGMPFTLPDPPSGCQKQSVSLSEKQVHFEQERDENYKDAADAARMAALSAERASAAAITIASLAKEHFVRMRSDNISKRSTSESSSGSDEDDYKDETAAVKQPPANASECYFSIKMDSFDAQIKAAESDSPDGHGSIARPVFDEYPEDEPRSSRLQTGTTRKQAAIEDSSSEDDGSNSTERSASPLRRSWVENHQQGSSARHRSSGSRLHTFSPHAVAADGHYENVGQSAGSARTAARPPSQRSPPSLTQYSTSHHVHPKLPDFDDLSARFRALKSRT